jgi:hypothetical protein
MAGPVAIIISKNIISKEQIQEINKYLKNNTTEIEGNDFWINDRPFIISYGEEYENQFQEYINDGTNKIIGWEPIDQMIIAAMSNQQIDHIILAELCISISIIIDGLIYFGGVLNINNDLIFGKLYNLPDGSHIGDTTFLKNWLNSKIFRMIK